MWRTLWVKVQVVRFLADSNWNLFIVILKQQKQDHCSWVCKKKNRKKPTKQHEDEKKTVEKLEEAFIIATAGRHVITAHYTQSHTQYVCQSSANVSVLIQWRSSNLVSDWNFRWGVSLRDLGKCSGLRVDNGNHLCLPPGSWTGSEEVWSSNKPSGDKHGLKSWWMDGSTLKHWLSNHGYKQNCRQLRHIQVNIHYSNFGSFLCCRAGNVRL